MRVGVSGRDATVEPVFVLRVLVFSVLLLRESGPPDGGAPLRVPAQLWRGPVPQLVRRGRDLIVQWRIRLAVDHGSPRPAVVFVRYTLMHPSALHVPSVRAFSRRCSDDRGQAVVDFKMR